MKSSLILSFLILLGTAFVALWQRSAAGPLNEEHEALRAEVSRLGVDPATLSGEQGSLSRMRLKEVLGTIDTIDARAARDARTRAFAREISEFAAAQKTREHRGPPDAETQAGMLRVMEGLLDLQGNDFRVLVDAFRTDSTLTENTRQELAGMAVMMLGRENPRSALDLLAESREEILKGGRSGFMVGMCLQGLAQKDAPGALAWIDAHRDLVDEQAMRQAMQGVAMRDPELAMKRVLERKEGGGRDIGPVTVGMTSNLNDAAGRESLLTMIRKTVPPAAAAAAPETPGTAAPETAGTGQRARQLRDGVLTGMGARLTEGSFEESKAWLASGALSEEEKYKVVDGIASALYARDPAPWLEWMSENLPPDRMAQKLGQIIPAWTQQDFNAVGAWLNGQPAGKAKEEAVLSFAETLQPHEPEAALRWAESLPDSPRKQELMNKLVPPPPAAPAPAADPAPGAEGAAPDQTPPAAAAAEGTAAPPPEQAGGR